MGYVEANWFPSIMDDTKNKNNNFYSIQTRARRPGKRHRLYAVPAHAITNPLINLKIILINLTKNFNLSENNTNKSYLL